MRSTLHAAVLGLTAAAAALSSPLGVARAASIDWSEPSREPADAVAAAQASDEYAWRLFVAINWPARPRMRRVDRHASLAADHTALWETWPTANDVFRRDGGDPGPWNGLRPGASLKARFEHVSAKDRPNLRHLEHGVMVPGADPATAAQRLTEVRLNRAAFDYLRERKLYNLDGQLRAYRTGAAVGLPPAAKLIKARWRPISDAERWKYHTLEVRLGDGTTRLYGLVALHVATKDLPTWFWATFEHEDNATRPGAEASLRASQDRFACGDPSIGCNRFPSGIGLEGTVWSHYRLRGTMTRFVDELGAPLRLANSDLEAGMQASASCITCHSRASIGIAGGQVVRLPVFDEAQGADPLGRLRGFVGLPRPEWYGAGAADRIAATRYQPLDFVWSLALAQPLRVGKKDCAVAAARRPPC